MRYDISKPIAPKMPILGKGTECIKILFSQASKDIQEPLVPMFFPVLGAHISVAEFQYPDNSWKELTGMMANLVAKSGDNKGQLPSLTTRKRLPNRNWPTCSHLSTRQSRPLSRTPLRSRRRAAAHSISTCLR